MTTYSHAGPLPHHQYVWIEPNAIGHHDWLRAVWFGLVCHPGRMWGCHVMLQQGAWYRNVPLHHLAHDRTAPAWAPKQAQTWDCYGRDFSTLEYPYLAGLTTCVKVRGSPDLFGEYLFTVVPIGDAFSAEPEQAKEFCFVKLDNGRFTSQPTNHLLFEERSFTDAAPSWPGFLRAQTEVWSCEDDE